MFSSFKMFPVFQFPRHFRHTVLVHFEFYWLGTLWSHHLEHHKDHFKWATREHPGYFLWENSRCPHGFPKWDILVTWPGKLWMYWAFSFNEPLRDIAGTFFGKIQNVPMHYLMGTSQSHDWEHCECTGHFLCWEHCNEISLENSECVCNVPSGFGVGTLSISLQCTCSVPAGYTTPCPQWV